MKEKTTFYGYTRKDGTVGIRNTVLVLYTVNCARFVAKEIVRGAKEEGIPAQLIGNGPCFDNQTVIFRMLSLMAHGNVGAVLIVGHGCEFIQAEKLLRFAKERQKPAEMLLDQKYGTTRAIDMGMQAVRSLWRQIQPCERQNIPIDRLCLGIIDPGERTPAAILAEQLAAKWIGDKAAVLLSNACAATYPQPADDTDAAPDIQKIQAKTREFCTMHGLPANPSSFSELNRFSGALKLTQWATGGGLWYLDTLQDSNMETGLPYTSFEGKALDFICSGAHLIINPLKRGTVSGCAVAPTLSLCGDASVLSAFADEIDYAAGNDSEALETKVLRVCGGEQTAAEKLKVEEGELYPSFQNQNFDL